MPRLPHATLRDSDSVGLEWSPGIGISDKLLDDADAARSGTTL